MENKITKIVAVLAVLGLMAAGPVAYAEQEGAGLGDGKGYKHIHVFWMSAIPADMTAYPAFATHYRR